MDGDSGDEGNDELTCVRSDESDVFLICRQAKFLGKLILETGKGKRRGKKKDGRGRKGGEGRKHPKINVWIWPLQSATANVINNM